MGSFKTITVLGLAAIPGCALFLAGNEAESARGPCPANMSFVEGPKHSYCIDRYEASIVERTEHGEAPFSPYRPVTGHKVRAVSQPGVVPQAYISMVEAQDACKASKKRLCSEEEWVTACRGPRPSKFPYGDEHKEGVCNDHGEAPLPKICGGRPESEMFGRECMNDPRLNQERRTVSRTGSHNRCKNAYGVFDMVGNVHEWVDDPSGTFRGGYYLDAHINGEGCSYRTDAHDAIYHDYSTGFRCCADVRTRGAK